VIGSYSCSHLTRMAALTRSEMDREWRESLATLSAIVGEAVKAASVPGGYYSRQVAESAAAAGIEVLFTSEPTVTAATQGGCLVLGRYVVKRGMSPEWFAVFAAGRRSFRWRQTTLRKAKRVAKSLLGGGYIKSRPAMLEKYFREINPDRRRDSRCLLPPPPAARFSPASPGPVCPVTDPPPGNPRAH
jgi:hypothetical protein